MMIKVLKAKTLGMDQWAKKKKINIKKTDTWIDFKINTNWKKQIAGWCISYAITYIKLLQHIKQIPGLL